MTTAELNILNAAATKISAEIDALRAANADLIRQQRAADAAGDETAAMIIEAQMSGIAAACRARSQEVAELLALGQVQIETDTSVGGVNVGL